MRTMWFGKLQAWARKTEKLNARGGKRIWTRQLVLLETSEDGGTRKRVYLSDENVPAFRCVFVGEQGDKHLTVLGPDGRLYTTHKCYAGKNPAVTVSFDGFYAPATDKPKRSLRHMPGTSWPDKTTEVEDISYPPFEIVQDIRIRLPPSEGMQKLLSTMTSTGSEDLAGVADEEC